MTDFDDFERRLADAIRSDADANVGPYAPASIARAAVADADAGPGATRARRASRPRGHLGRGRGITLLAAAAVLLVGGALVGSAALRRPSVVPPVPAPTVAAAATASPDATATATASPTPPSLDLTWANLPFDAELDILSAAFDRGEQSTRLAWVGDRFVLVELRSGAVLTSADGQAWEAVAGDAAQRHVDLLRGSVAIWQDQAVGWWNPEERLDPDGPDIAGTPPITARDVVQVVWPPSVSTSTTPFKGRIESMAIGPRGIVAQVHSHLDWDAWVTKKLGLRTNNDWTCCVRDVTFEDGVLEIKLSNGPGLKVVWADQGLEPGDYQDRGFGWYSPHGERWTAIWGTEQATGETGSSSPTGGFGSVVGVSDGFIATGSEPDESCADPEAGCTGLWFSSDGLTWRLLGTGAASRLVPWNGGALAIDDAGRATVWTSSGSEDLPMAATLDGTVATGPLGIVSIGDGQVLVSRDGIDHRVGSLPVEMADAVGDGEGSIVVAIGDQTVLVLVRARTGESTMTQSLWLGTFEP